MALSKELTDTVKQVIKELELNQQFEQIFLKHLEKESNFQADEEEWLDRRQEDNYYEEYMNAVKKVEGHRKNKKVDIAKNFIISSKASASSSL